MLLNCMLEKTLTESPLDCKELKPVTLNIHWKHWCWNWTPILWPLDVKSWFIGKDPDAGKDWRQEEKGIIEDEIIGWHHWLNEHEFEWTLGVGDGQESLVCCSPWGHKESDMTEWLNWLTDWLTDWKTLMKKLETAFKNNVRKKIEGMKKKR